MSNAPAILPDTDDVVTTKQAAAARRGERIFNFPRLCRVALKLHRGDRLTAEESRQWGYLAVHHRELVTDSARRLEADRLHVWLELKTLRGGREFHEALGHVQPLLRVRVPRRAPSSGRPAGRRTRRTSGSRGDPPGDGGPGEPPPVAALRDAVRP